MFSGNHLTKPSKTHEENKNWLKKETSNQDFRTKLPIKSTNPELEIGANSSSLFPTRSDSPWETEAQSILRQEAKIMWWYALTLGEHN